MVLVHTISSLLSYVAFLIAFVSGVLFLIQERQLKRKTMGFLFHRLPSLESLDRINFAALGVGFGLLSVGVVCGLAGMRVLLGQWWISDPKAYFTILLWGLYLLLWLTRLRATLRGRRVAFLSVLGFSLIVFTLLGTTYLVPSLHPYL